MDRLLPFSRIDDDAGPFRIIDIAVLLAVIGVRLVEGDAVPAPVEGADYTAIVCGRSVPVCRDQA